MKNIGIITSQDKYVKRIQDISAYFDIEYRHWKNLDDFYHNHEKCNVYVALDDDLDTMNPVEFIQTIKYNYPTSYVISAVKKLINEEMVHQFNSSQADAVFLWDEILYTTKLEFIITQIIKNMYLPIKVDDLIVNTYEELDKYLKQLQNNEQVDEYFIFEANLLTHNKK